MKTKSYIVVRKVYGRQTVIVEAATLKDAKKQVDDMGKYELDIIIDQVNKSIGWVRK